MTENTDASDERAFFEARGFGRTIGYGLRPAIICIDFTNAFTDPSLPLGGELTAEMIVARTVLDAGRRTGVPIIHTTVSYDDEGLADAGVWALKQAGTTTLRAGTPAVEVHAMIGRLPSEPVLVKKYASAFFGTDLVPRLVSKSVDTLILVGCTTSGCVRATAVDAVQHGFRPMVVRDAVGDRSQAAHAQALFDLEQKYADVVTVESVTGYLGGLQ